MYKKITCAFCFVISTFIIAVVVYLLLAEWQVFSERPPKIQVPQLGIYLVNNTTERLLHKTRNSEYILNFQSLQLTVTDASHKPGKNADYEEHSYKKRSNNLRIRCHSNYPVQLKYIGFGNVTEASNLNRRQIEDFIDRSSYNYSTELEFSTVDEGITGKYECQVRDELQGINMASSFIYIYATGLNSFVSHSTRELIVEPGSFIEIPCPVSHPSKSISLFLVKPLMEGSEVVREVDAENIVAFDPKRGFILHPNNYGLFFCKDTKTGEVCGRVSVLMPLNKVVKGSTLRIYSQNVNNTDKSLKLECRAKDPVELKFINFIRFSKQPKILKNDSNEFPHAVRIKINKEWFAGNMSIVQCLTIGSRRVIKIWKFLKDDLPGQYDQNLVSPKVRLERVKNFGYQCCSYGLSMRPSLRTYPCSTPTECDFRLPCLSIDPLRRTPADPSCPLLESANEDIYQGETGCTRLKLVGNSSGIIRCALDADVRDYSYFHASEFDGAYSSIMNTSKKKIEPNSVLRVIQKGARSKGASIRFECEGSKLHFSKGFQWAVERVNEPLKYLISRNGFRSGDLAEANSIMHHEWIDVPLIDRSKTRVYCFAPLVNPPLLGQQWVNVSTAVRYDVFL